MRKRIYRISEDKFDDLKPNIVFEQTEIVDDCYTSEKYQGKISFFTDNGVSARGAVYCDSPYVELPEPMFSGEKVTIPFVIDNYNFKSGEALVGKFTLVFYGLEKEIPFRITYTKRALSVSTGELISLQDFSDFAQAHFTEACNIFYSDRFADFIDNFDPKTRLIYRAFKAAPISKSSLDEFLVACDFKRKMTFDLTERQDTYYEVSENIRGSVEITRSTWGYIDIRVSSDADFVSVEKENITSDFFLGSIFNMNYYIHKELMHPGLNFAKLSFDFADVHKEITILASVDRDDYKVSSPSITRDKAYLQLCRDYESYRLKKIPLGAWVKNSLDIIEGLDIKEEDENFFLLIKAMIFVLNKQKQEALWIIQDLKRTIEDKRSTDWAFLLYLCTLIEPEESYVDKLTENIESIFLEHPKDVRIFWFLLFLRKEYFKNSSEKLRDIFEWIDQGKESPLLYIEAYYTYLQDPYLISSLDDHTLKILAYATKRNVVTRDMAVQMIHVLESERVYNPKAFPILAKCYEVYPDLQLLLSIVTYLLKSPTVEDEFLPWLRLAIENNLHVSGIFEAYMMALPSQSVEKLPQLITMFFRYNNDLPWDKKALLYANIILHKKEDRGTYNQYEKAIENFTLDQLRLKRLDDNLAICYQNLMEDGIFDEGVAKIYAELICKKKLIVPSGRPKRALIYFKEFKANKVVNLNNNFAYIDCLGQEPVILLENENGILFYDENAYMLEDVLQSDEYLAKLRQLCPDNMAFVLRDFSSSSQASELDSNLLPSAERILHSSDIAPGYKNKLYPLLVSYLRIHNREDVLVKHFINEADLTKLSAAVIADVLDVFITAGKYEEAYYMMKHTNGTMLKDDVASKLFRFLINKKDENRPEDFLITWVAKLVESGKTHSDLLYFLIRYYVGPTKLMLLIYKESKELNLDLVDFSERIIIQMLYRDLLEEPINDIFDTYMGRKNNKMVVEAFLTYESHEYLSGEREIRDNIFEYITDRLKTGKSFNESMRIALLKYLCLNKDISPDQLDVLDVLLADSIIKNQYFGFFKFCHNDLRVKYHLYDKFFVEYKGKKQGQVSILYSINGVEHGAEDMIEMYDGLYVKQFILFFGDELKYEIYDESADANPAVSEKYVKGDDVDDTSEGRFGLMNSISRHGFYRDRDGFASDLKKYQGLDVVTKELFTTI
ncbi:MAG: DUF5717 family protein [Pseudobutyrivibrio sp.]|nr:DUF5717 family protein [Pseudobutyrivibrio sp.]